MGRELHAAAELQKQAAARQRVHAPTSRPSASGASRPAAAARSAPAGQAAGINKLPYAMVSPNRQFLQVRLFMTLSHLGVQSTG